MGVIFHRERAEITNSRLSNMTMTLPRVVCSDPGEIGPAGARRVVERNRVARRRANLSTTFGVLALLAMALWTTGTASATSLTLSWSSLSSSIKPGTYATATVKVTRGAKCGIVVRYSTTVSRAAGLITKIAPSTGRLSWRWKVGTNTHKGTWRVTVTCTLGKVTKSIWRTMTIT